MKTKKKNKRAEHALDLLFFIKFLSNSIKNDKQKIFTP